MTDPAPVQVVYVLYRYPQLSQTFVRDEIWALRDAGTGVDVVSLDDPGRDRPADTWAGPFAVAPHPGPLGILRDACWWAWRRPYPLARFVWLSLREGRRAGYVLGRGLPLARQMARDPPGAVHTHFAWITATVAAGVAMLIDRPCSITVHAKDIYAQPPSMVRRRLASFRQVVTVCHFNVGYLEGLRLVSPLSPVPRVINCGVSIGDTPPPREPTTDLVAVGRLVDKKGFDVLLHALAGLDPASPITATIVGDGPERETLEALSASLGLSAQVTFAGSLPHEETLQTINRGRVFCLPSRRSADGDSDAMPVVIREAMARGIPVVASRLAGIPESVDDEVGWLVEPGSSSSLGVALAEALRDPDEAALRGTRGFARAAHQWRFDDQARLLLRMLDELRDASMRLPPSDWLSVHRSRRASRRRRRARKPRRR